MRQLDRQLSAAVRYFWDTLRTQGERQGTLTGTRDAGNRSAATGGAQMQGFENLVKELLVRKGIPEEAIFCKRNVVLPGFFRPTKDWDLVMVYEEQLIASVEFKSQVGPSFGNNFNNRTEEALGSAADLWTAYREGAFMLSQRPWLGYLMLLEEEPKSMRPVGVAEPHFKVFEEYRGASYAQRYGLLCQKLVRERLYDAACFLMTDRLKGRAGYFREPSEELSFHNFITSLIGHAVIRTKMSRKRKR